jgi:hypothetical protein
MGQGEIIERVESVLRDAFPDMEMDIYFLPEDGRVHGSVFWNGFAGLDHIDRQHELRRPLKEKLGDEYKRVGVLLAYTPEELESMRAA